MRDMWHGNRRGTTDVGPRAHQLCRPPTFERSRDFLKVAANDECPVRWHRALVIGASSYFLVAQKISAMASISLTKRSATATSFVFFASPADLVAFQKRSCRSG